MILPCSQCITLSICRSKYSHCKAIYCDLIKKYFSDLTATEKEISSRIYEFNNFLWRKKLAEEYIQQREKEK